MLGIRDNGLLCAALTRFDEHSRAEIGGDNVETCTVVNQIQPGTRRHFLYSSHG